MNDFIRARRKQQRARSGARRFGRKAILNGARPRRKLARSMLPPSPLPAIPDHVSALAAYDPTTRISRVPFHQVFRHRSDGLCRCGCSAPVPEGRRSWASDECEKGAVFAYWYWKGDPTAIEWALWRRDKGVCAACGTPVPGGRKGPWHGHHKIAVHNGGARLGLSNMVTVCHACHKKIHAADNGVANEAS